MVGRPFPVDHFLRQDAQQPETAKAKGMKPAVGRSGQGHFGLALAHPMEGLPDGLRAGRTRGAIGVAAALHSVMFRKQVSQLVESILRGSASICYYNLQLYRFLLWIYYELFLEGTPYMPSSDQSSLFQSLFSLIFPKVVFQFPFLYCQKSSR